MPNEQEKWRKFLQPVISGLAAYKDDDDDDAFTFEKYKRLEINNTLRRIE